MNNNKVAFEDRKIPVSITLTLKHIAIIENLKDNKQINNTSEYIRKLITEDNDGKN